MLAFYVQALIAPPPPKGGVSLSFAVLLYGVRTVTVIVLATRRLSVLRYARVSSCALSASVDRVARQRAGPLCVVRTMAVCVSAVERLPVTPLAHAKELMCAHCICITAMQCAGSECCAQGDRHCISR